MNTNIHLTDLHNENRQWGKSLAFYKDEIGSFEKRLAEIIAANTVEDVTAQAEHFQNQFIRQHEVIDTLKHQVNKAEDALVKQIEANPVATEHKTAPDHTDLRNAFETFEKLYTGLKSEFNKFVAQTL